MRNLWRRWSDEIPHALGDACGRYWWFDRLTVRKVIESVVIALLAIAFAQTLPIDLAFLFAGDMLMYLEFMVAIRLAAGVMHVRAVWNQVTRVA